MTGVIQLLTILSIATSVSTISMTAGAVTTASAKNHVTTLASDLSANSAADQYAELRKNDDFYEIRLAEPIREEVVPFSFSEAQYFSELDSQCRDQLQSVQTDDSLNFSGVSVGTIINIGLKIWKIIQEGKPTVKVKTASASALPKGLFCWQDLENWQAPEVRRYSATYENTYGIEVVKFSFKVIYIYGGQYKGKGRYLTGLRVVPEHVKTLWGFDLDADAAVPNVVNMGSKTNPVAGAEVQVKWTVKSVLKEIRRSTNFFVSGNGDFRQL